MASVANKRLAKEYEELQTDPLDNVDVGLEDENLFHWVITVIGPDDTPYAGGIFVIDLTIPNDYPFREPVVKFKTQIFHPQVNEKKEVCPLSLWEKWDKQTLRFVLGSLYGLLRSPNFDHITNTEVARLKDDPKKFQSIAKEWTKKYAS